MESKEYKGGRRVSVCKASDIAEKVRFFRQNRGLSQSELADGICSPSLISQIENGSTTTVEMLTRIADKLRVPLRELYNEIEEDCPYPVRLDMAEAHIHRGELESAQKILDYLKNQEDLVKIEYHRLVLLQGMLFNKAGKQTDAIEILQTLLDQIEQTREPNTDDELTCQLYNQVGNAHYFLRNYIQAYSAYKQAYQVSLRLPAFETTSAIAAYNLGMICSELGIGEKATLYLEQAKSYFESISDPQRLAQVYFSFAIATKNKEYVQRALQLYQNLNMLKMVHTVRQFHVFHIQAIEDYKSAAQELYDIALEMDKLGEKGDCLFTLTRAVFVCIDHGDLAHGKHYLSLAAEYVQKVRIESPYDLALYHRANAKMYLALGNYDACIDEAQKSSEMYEQVGKFNDCAESLEISGEAYQRKGMHEEACKIYKEVAARLRHSQ